MTTNTNTLWFHIQSDYRSGPKIYTFNKTPEDEYEDAYPITFEMPKEGYRMYIVNDFPEYEVIWYKDLNDNDDFNEIYLKIFSQIHNCMPFKVTDHNSAGKEEGEYPDISEKIKNLPNIAEDIVEKIKEDFQGYYFFCVIDNEGTDIFTELLQPIY